MLSCKNRSEHNTSFNITNILNFCFSNKKKNNTTFPSNKNRKGYIHENDKKKNKLMENDKMKFFSIIVRIWWILEVLKQKLKTKKMKHFSSFLSHEARDFSLHICMYKILWLRPWTFFFVFFIIKISSSSISRCHLNVKICLNIRNNRREKETTWQQTTMKFKKKVRKSLRNKIVVMWKKKLLVCMVWKDEKVKEIEEISPMWHIKIFIHFNIVENGKISFFFVFRFYFLFF